MTDENKTFDEYINNLRQICIEQALYDLPDDLKDAKTKSQIEFNKKLLRKYDHTNTVFLDSEIPYVIRDNFFMQDKKEIEEASSYTATYKE